MPAEADGLIVHRTIACCKCEMRGWGHGLVFPQKRARMPPRIPPRDPANTPIEETQEGHRTCVTP